VAVSEYVRRPRARVGHDLLLLPSVSLLVLDGPRLLLVRHAGLGDDWGLVGGAIEVGESPAEAAVREAREEIGVDVELTRLADVGRRPLDRFTRALLTATGQLDRSVPRTARSRRGACDSAADAVRP
jgi:8-oxo-dGTP pyrophosphatase MutT (NUDIX family)